MLRNSLIRLKSRITRIFGNPVSRRVKPIQRQNSQIEFLESRCLLTNVLGGNPDTTLAGTLLHDRNLNGVKDPGEEGLADWTVYLDLNQDGILDTDVDGIMEPSVLSNVDGDYLFTGVVPGTYRVSEILPVGWSALGGAFVDASVVASTETKVNFFNYESGSIGHTGEITGTVWLDANGDGNRAIDPVSGNYTDPPLANWTIYLDQNDNDTLDPGEVATTTDLSGSFQFTGLTNGTYKVNEVVPAGWEVSPGFIAGNGQSVIVTQTVAATLEFANFSDNVATVFGTVWDDTNGNSIRDTDPATGAYTESGLIGWTIFVDSNLDGSLTPGELSTTTDASGNYSLAIINPGPVTIVAETQLDWRATHPASANYSVNLTAGDIRTGYDFGFQGRQDASIAGVVYSDSNHNGIRDLGERGLTGVTVYLDLNNNGKLDTGEPSQSTSQDLFYTPLVDETGTYHFTHLAKGNYAVREILPDDQLPTPMDRLVQNVVIDHGTDYNSVNFGNYFRPNEIHGVAFDDANGNHIRDLDEAIISSAVVYIDLNRNDVRDAGEPETTTASDGSYSFTGLTPGSYVVRQEIDSSLTYSYPLTGGGILWPDGSSNPAVGNVSPLSIQTSLADGESYRTNVSLTLPGSGALTNMVDVFLLFDDTGSFTSNSPIVRAAFPQIISALQTALPGIDLGFGVGRFEEYGNFAAENPDGRPFILNQPIISASTSGFQSAIQAALDRETPGYGGDTPETIFEALYQTVTGAGFDGNNNGSTQDSGAVGLISTQLTPGDSGDVPAFSSWTADPSGTVLPPSGNLGGAGFRPGALPIILAATDTGFAFQPYGDTTITGLNGITLPISQLTQASRDTTPFNYGAGIQQTITGLNALGALVIGLGTNPESNIDPRQGLEAISMLTGSTNQSTTTIDNGTTDPIAPGDPFYFQITTGFGDSVAQGVQAAIQNAVTNVAVNVTLQASDPRVHIINHTGVENAVGAGQTASFDVEFTGDGIPHRFDLQFVREGTNVVLGSIPVVLGTPIAGEGYEFEDLGDGELELHADFGTRSAALPPVNTAPSFTPGKDVTVSEDAGPQTVSAWATNVSPGPYTETTQKLDFIVTCDHPELFVSAPQIAADGTLTFETAPNGFGSTTITVQLHDDGGTLGGGHDTSSPVSFLINVLPVNDAPVSHDDNLQTMQDTPLTVDPLQLFGNDTDVENDPLSFVLDASPTHGILTLETDGTYTYQPDPGFNGTDSFTYHANDGTSDGNIATVNITVSPPPPTTKYVVVDGGTRKLYGYAVDGELLGTASLNAANKHPKAVASRSDGSRLWVTDNKGVVFLYDDQGHSQGTITLTGVSNPEGIVCHDSDLWVLDRGTNRVLFYAGGANLTSGTISPTSSFSLGRKFRNAVDLTTDGTHLWVLSSSSTDMVYRYDLSGHLQGSWSLAANDSSPTGITCDAEQPNDLLVVDSRLDTVFRYQGASLLTSGTATNAVDFALDRVARNPSGITVPGANVVLASTLSPQALDAVFSGITPTHDLFSSVASQQIANASGFGGTFKIGQGAEGSISWGVELGTPAAFTGRVLIDAGNLGGMYRYSGGIQGRKLQIAWGDVGGPTGYFQGTLSRNNSQVHGILVVKDPASASHLRRHCTLTAR